MFTLSKGITNKSVSNKSSRSIIICDLLSNKIVGEPFVKAEAKDLEAKCEGVSQNC